MNGLLVPLEVVLALALLLAVLLAVVVARRRFLARSSGTFDCSLRTRLDRKGKGWTLGLARYEVDRIEWFRVFDLSPLPRRVLHRADLAVQQRRYPSGPEAFTVMAGSVVVRCASESGPIELAMSDQAYTGFASWLESAPPGQNVSVA